MFHLIFTLLPPPSFKHKPFFCSEDSNWDLYGPEDVENSPVTFLWLFSHTTKYTHLQSSPAFLSG